MLTRGYRVVRPPWGRIPHGTSSCHGPHPRTAHRRAVDRIPTRPVHRRVMGRIPHGLTGQTAPKGSHYSVAVGERSEPAEGGPPIIIGPKGVEHTVHAGRSAGTSSCRGAASPHGRHIVVPRVSDACGPKGAEQPYALSWMFGPLGPQVASCRRAAQAAWAAPRSGIGFHHVIMARLALRVGFIFWKNRGTAHGVVAVPRCMWEGDGVKGSRSACARPKRGC